MTQSTVIVEGGDRLAATMASAARELADLTSAGNKAGELVRGRAASDAPKRTGRLAGSLRVSASASEVTVSASAVYAAVINSGWPAHNITAQPFLTNALDEMQRAALDVYGDRVDQIVGTIKGL